MRARYLTGLLTPTLLLFGLSVLATASAYAQGTPDGETPAEETVCDDAGLTGAAYGLCNAYCEAMDCDSANPNANSNACMKVLSDFTKHSEELIPCGRAVCPCSFSDSDVDNLRDVCPTGLLACGDVQNHGGEITKHSIYMQCEAGFMDCGGCALRTNFDQNIPNPQHENRCSALGGIPGTPDVQIPDLTIDEFEACGAVLTNRFGDCDQVFIQP
jgi:hypothetical protein